MEMTHIQPTKATVTKSTLTVMGVWLPASHESTRRAGGNTQVVSDESLPEAAPAAPAAAGVAAAAGAAEDANSRIRPASILQSPVLPAAGQLGTSHAVEVQAPLHRLC